MPAAKKTANLKSANLRKPLNKTTANKNSPRVTARTVIVFMCRGTMGDMDHLKEMAAAKTNFSAWLVLAM